MQRHEMMLFFVSVLVVFANVVVLKLNLLKYVSEHSISVPLFKPL